MKKHIPPFLLAACPYFFYLLAWLQAALSMGLAEKYPSAGELAATIFSVQSLAAVPVLFITNVVYALRCKSLTAAELARWDFLIKLCHIPVYVVLFLFALLMLLAIAAPAVLMMALVLVPIIFIFDLTLLLTSSCYGFRALRIAKQEGLVDKKWARRHTIAHCIFVADVVSAFLVWRRLKGCGFQ